MQASVKKAADMRSLRVSDFKFRRDLFWVTSRQASNHESLGACPCCALLCVLLDCMSASC